MASTPNDEGARPRPLPNHPETKMPAIPKGTRIQKRPLPGPSPSHSRSNSAVTFDQDGYHPPPRATHTAVIKVSSGASFMSLVKRVRKALEKTPQSATTKGLSLAARVATLKVAKPNSATSGINSSKSQKAGIEDALDDVVLVATGKAIQKAVEVGAFFTRERELVVLVRTRTLQAVDDVVVEDEDTADVEDQVRVRNVSCIEVGIRWASL
ncbi:Rpp20 subunit of nuclear RNase MRP and P-domain-containing protein [Chaetomium strumarium]|uniref:Rpp20 subunit of nuclear RNase MRP and P-domain-containing protein n=1 Tax=Chaetomium strumarium TaxID=1170767 RepID=A0AAJ0M7F5_9PEZI|nr:Rpp20 subunit of nuclear RNase MRP and P-domain-containing protein [Chaetomium strumarium]